MEDNSVDLCGVLFGGIFIGASLTASLGSLVIGYCRRSWEKDAVEHGAAEYDSVTGEWKWKQEVADED